MVDLGCPGETTTSMRTTPAQADCASLYRRIGSSSQLAAARVFLDHHQGQVAVVTLDIGANDIDHCISTSGRTRSCLASADFDLERNFGVIVRRIQVALRRDDPSARLLTMNYYDPYLAFAYLPGGTRGAQLAAESLVGVDTLNAQFAASDRLLDVGVADVAGAFKINSSLPLLSYAGKELPKNVGVTCELTWMCPTDSVTKPNIHPNLAGYSTIAFPYSSAFSGAVPRRANQPRAGSMRRSSSTFAPARSSAGSCRTTSVVAHDRGLFVGNDLAGGLRVASRNVAKTFIRSGRVCHRPPAGGH